MAKEGKTAVVPRLRFPEFQGTEEWKERTLSDLATVIMGSSPKSESYNEVQSGLPLLQGNADIRNRVSAPRVFTSEITKECQIDDILMSVRAPAGSVAKSIHHACIGRGIAAIRAKQPNSQEFLYQCLLSFQPKWVNISQGGTFDAINSDDLKGVGLTSPMPAEQQKIADCLTSLDELIAALGRKVEALKTYKRGLMLQLFPREGETLPRLRFPEFRDAPEWEEATIGSRSKSFSGGTPDTANKSYYGGAIHFIRSAEIGKVGTELSLTELGLKNSAVKLVEPGDVLVALYGANSGDVALAKIGGAINQAILCLRPEGNKPFLYHFLAAKKAWILATFIQGGQGNLSGEIIKSISLRYPSKEEQKLVADCLSSLDARIVAEGEKFEALKTHKNGLMQQLFPSLEEA